MSIAAWHAALTVVAMLGFIAIVRWAYKGDSNERFGAIARLALEEDSRHEGDHS